MFLGRKRHWDVYLKRIQEIMEDTKSVSGILFREFESFIHLFEDACVNSGCEFQLYV